MMLPFKEQFYKTTVLGETVLVGDIGGTNSNFGLCLINHDQKRVSLAYSLHIKSSQIDDFAHVVRDVLKHIERKFETTITTACFGVAGIINEEKRAKPTNLSFIVDTDDIKQQTTLKNIFIINDFVMLGYGLEVIDKKSIHQIYAGSHIPYANKAIIGAGTGLGKTILVWLDEKKIYIPLSSEGGHADFPVQYEQELALIEFIREQHQLVSNISWEDVLSGEGIMMIYEFLSVHKKYKSMTKKVSNDVHDIFSLSHTDAHCNDTVEWFTQFYARCAKDFALNSLSRNGLYIAGGIAAHNPTMFQRSIFMQEFLNNREQKELLKDIPLYVITDYAISLYGGALYILLWA